MSPRSHLETRIAERLAILSDADMQRLAEDYARLRHPERFPHFDFRAFSPEGKSRPGWPDAYVLLPDGRIDGVEATGTKDKGSVLKHLRMDLEKAQKHDPNLAGFLFISGHPQVQLNARELDDWRSRFADEARLDPARIELVFGGRLVRELTGPEFVRTRFEILRLPDKPRWFKLVRPEISPDEGRLRSDFLPSPEDYARGRVHRPDLANQVAAHLDREGCALVRGIGASGKTIMAWLLGLEAAARRQPAYYLDLARIADTGPEIANALADDLSFFGHPQVLFMLDNIHLDEPLAKELVVSWQDLIPAQRPRLLLVGRELRTGRGSPIEGLPIPTLPLKARQAEVLGVYRRLAWRRSKKASPPDPPAAVLNDWVTTFGGNPSAAETTTDLIAFSAAVLRRMPRWLPGEWGLSARDAVEEVREAYLDHLTEGECRNLMRLCAMAALELPVSHDALPDPHAGFRLSSRRLGLVFWESVGPMDQFVRYRLAHAALGRLILSAAHESIDAVKERRALAIRHATSGFTIGIRLASMGQVDEARTICATLLSRMENLLDLLSLFRVHGSLRFAQSLGVPLPSELGDVLSSPVNLPRLVGQALVTPLQYLKGFFTYATNTPQLKTVFEPLTGELASSENRTALTERARLAPLHALQPFLAYAAKTPQLKTVFEALTKDLARPENLEKLTERARLAPLHALQAFLAYAAKTPQLKTVFEALTEDLARPEIREKLTERALLTPLDHLQSFLTYAAETRQLKGTFDAVADNLARLENRKYLAHLGAAK